VIEAIESVVPLRRCTVRMGRNYAAPADAPVCSAAQLGVAMCPCSGTADPERYVESVSFIVDALTVDSAPLFELLTARLTSLALAQRYEEAANVRDRMQALSQALHRQRRCDQLRSAGTLVVQRGDVEHEFDHGVLVAVRTADRLFAPLITGSGPVLPALAPLLDPATPMPNGTGPLTRDLYDELMCVSRFLEAHAEEIRIISCSGDMASSTPPIPEPGRLPLRQVA
jgi:DNA polymerase-3 subunit epsilon